MKILYLSQSGALGGAERVILDVAASVRAINPAWELALIAPAAGLLVDAARALGITTAIVPFPPSLARLGDASAADNGTGSGLGWWRVMGRLGASSPAIARYTQRLTRTIAEIQPDLIHANGFKMHLLGAWASPERSALLWHLHDFIGSRSLMRPLLRMHVRRCAILVANSRCVAEDARAALGANVPIRTVYNGVDLARFTPDGIKLDLDVCAGLDAPDPEIVRVGLIATAARWKGHDVFLRALAKLPRERSVRGYVIGGPIYQTAGSQFTMEELSAMAAGLALSGRVGFTGHVQDVAAAIRALDIVVHASVKPEPFGLVVAEAMTAGRAVITSAIGGVAELIEVERTALVHRPNDDRSLASAIERLAADPELRARLGREGRLTAVRRFDRKRMGAELASIYTEVIATRARRDNAASTHP